MAKRILFSALLLAIFVNGVSAGTNLQVFYDFGSAGTACGNQRSNRVTTTIELFYPDPWGTTFAFVDLDYNINPIDPQNTPFMSYAEFARCLNFWQQTKAKDLSVQVEYNGGLGIFKDAEGGIRQAYELAYATDTESAFGGIIAFNRELDAETAKAIVERQFVEVIIAPSVSAEAQAIVASKANVRLLTSGQWAAERAPAWDYKRVNGGLLVQSRDIGMITADDLKVVTKRAPSEQEINDLIFAWKVAKYVKSNAIVYAKNRQTIGVGAGQMSRVNSARIAAIKAEHAGLQVAGSVMASDAFFPFRDGLDNAAKVGITAVIQPGGSMRDAEVIAAADEAGIAMVFTGMRHFRH